MTPSSSSLNFRNSIPGQDSEVSRRPSMMPLNKYHPPSPLLDLPLLRLRECLSASMKRKPLFELMSILRHFRPLPATASQNWLAVDPAALSKLSFENSRVCIHHQSGSSQQTPPIADRWNESRNRTSADLIRPGWHLHDPWFGVYATNAMQTHISCKAL